MIRLGYQIPFFNYPGATSENLFDNVAAQARAAAATPDDSEGPAAVSVFFLDPGATAAPVTVTAAPPAAACSKLVSGLKV